MFTICCVAYLKPTCIDMTLLSLPRFREVSTYVGELYLGGSGVPNAHLVQVTSKDKALDGKIVECTCDHALRGWKVLRVRTDKTDPNHLSVGKCKLVSAITNDQSTKLINELI